MNCTVFPFFIAAVMVSRTAFTAWPAATLGRPISLATASTTCDLVIVAMMVPPWRCSLLYDWDYLKCIIGHRGSVLLVYESRWTGCRRTQAW